MLRKGPPRRRGRHHLHLLLRGRLSPRFRFRISGHFGRRDRVLTRRPWPRHGNR
jgi:hypothetical protein